MGTDGEWTERAFLSLKQKNRLKNSSSPCPASPRTTHSVFCLLRIGCWFTDPRLFLLLPIFCMLSQILWLSYEGYPLANDDDPSSIKRFHLSVIPECGILLCGRQKEKKVLVGKKRGIYRMTVNLLDSSNFHQARWTDVGSWRFLVTISSIAISLVHNALRSVLLTWMWYVCGSLAGSSWSWRDVEGLSERSVSVEKWTYSSNLTCI